MSRSALVTRDRDYGSLVFLKSLGAGVLYLRMQRGQFSLIAPTYREREKFCRLRPDTVKARLMRDTLQCPGNGTVSPLGKIVT
jgi:hypothetical protein